MTLLQSITDALDIALTKEPAYLTRTWPLPECFAARSGWRRSSAMGKEQVFNPPLCEQGIAGFAICLSVVGANAIAEKQFAY